MKKEGEELYEGAHQPLISKELFDHVQQIMTGKRQAHTKTMKPYVYRKLFTCAECSGMITIKTQKGYTYLRCTKKLGPCTQPYVREEAITAQISDALSVITTLRGWSEQMLSELKTEIDSDSLQLEAHRSDLRRRLSEADQKAKRLTDAYVANVLTLDEFQQAKNAVVTEKVALKQQSLAL